MGRVKPGRGSSPIADEGPAGEGDRPGATRGSPSAPLHPPAPLPAWTRALLEHLRAQRVARYRTSGASRDVMRGWGENDLNLVHLTGTLGSEPLLADIGDHPVASLTLACARRWPSPGGGVQLETAWFNLTAWEELAEQCGRQLHQGDRVYVEGLLHLWTELRGQASVVAHTIILDRIVLLVAGSVSPPGQAGDAKPGTRKHPVP